MRSLLLAVAALSAGCLVAPPGFYVRPTQPPTASAPPPYGGAPAPRLLSEREAVEIAGSWAASQGIQVDHVKHVHLDDDGRWHVDVRGRGKEKAKVLVDARTGRVLKGKVKAGHGKHGRDDEDDDD